MKKIYKNIIHLLNSHLIERILNTISFILIARLLSNSDYGYFTVALAFSSIFTYLGDLGMSNTLIREVSRDETRKYVFFSSFIKVKIVFSVVSGVISVIIASLLYKELLLNLTITLTIITLIGNSMLSICKAYFQSIQRMKYISKISYMASIFTFLGVTISFSVGIDNLMIVILIYSLSKLIGGIIALIITRSELIKCSWKYWDSKIVFGLFSFSLGGILLILFPQLPPLILQRGIPIEELAIFGIAQRIPLILYSIPAVIAGSFYPNLFKFSGRVNIHKKILSTEITLLSIVGTVLSIPFIVESDNIIKLLFGTKWLEASYILKLYVFVVVLQSLTFPLGDGLTTKGLQYKRNIVYFVGILVSIVGYFSVTVSFQSHQNLMYVVLVALSVELLILIGFLIFQPNLIKFTLYLLIQNLMSVFLSIKIISLVKVDFFIINIFLTIIFYLAFQLIFIKKFRLIIMNYIRGVK